jgi:electron transport complex protein RnfE
MKALKTLTNGIMKENPVFRLVLGTCPTLAVTTSARNGIGMGLAATAVLVGSNLVISLLRKVIPDKVRIPAYITIISGFVTIVQMLLKAYLPELDKELGIFIPLIVVNCIILARAEMFANKNNALLSVLDGIGMGIGFTVALLTIGTIREILGAGTWFGISITTNLFDPAIIMILPPGGFLVFGIIMGLINKFSSMNVAENKGVHHARCHAVHPEKVRRFKPDE